MIKNSKIEISPALLENELRKKQTTVTKASKRMGYADNYLSVSMSRGFLTRPAMIMLEELYGIKEEDITYVNTTATATEVAQVGQVDYMKLYNTVYAAVKNAMVDALNGVPKTEESNNG